MSARSSRDLVYPPQSARSPRISTNSFDRRSGLINRQPSFSSAYSSHSYRSNASSHSNGYSENINPGIIYTGRRVDNEIAPDYDNEPVVMRNKLNRTVEFDTMPEYAVVNKRRVQSTKVRDSAPLQLRNSYQSPKTNVRRVNSMYK